MRTRFGLHLVPREALDVGASRRLVTIGPAGAAAPRALSSWSEAGAGRSVEPALRMDAGEYPYDVALADTARRESRASAIQAARGLEYPVDELQAKLLVPPAGLLIRPLLLGLLGLGLAVAATWGLRRIRGSEAT